MKPYQYAVLRCVPRVEREEFLNVGVVLYCQAEDFLDAAWAVDAERLRSFAREIDVDEVCRALGFVKAVCAGAEGVGSVARLPLGERFGYLKAPRSTVLQPGPVHGGATADPAIELDRLLDRYVG